MKPPLVTKVRPARPRPTAAVRVAPIVGERVARQCACRGFLEANPADADGVERAVREHQRELRHQAWRALEQLGGRLVAPESVAIFSAVRRVA